jgi:pimeloyl-ACP methyl ester carboxylesterase
MWKEPFMMKRSFSLAIVGLALAFNPLSVASAADIKNVVIVHGAFADGSGWRAVSDGLTGQGYKVTVVQQPLTSLEDDVSATKRILEIQDGPSVLVGHSYGGMVITDAGNAKNVAGLVYIAAFQPDQGESLVELAQGKPVPNMRKDSLQATKDGFFYLNPEAFPELFAADLPKADAEFLARSQVFASRKAFTTEAGAPAWKTKPSWALVATEDRSINPDLERDMAKRAGSTVSEVKASHAVYASRPDDVVKLIVEAAQTLSK